jgi:hypothetical protein
MAVRGLGDALNIIGQGIQQKAQVDWQEQRQANLDRIRREERTEARELADRSFELQKKGQEHSIESSERSYKLQEENVRADNASRNAQLGIAREGLNLQKDNSEFSRVENAFAGAMAGVASITQRMAEIEKQQPKIGADGTPVEDPQAFQDRKVQMLADLEDKLEAERARAKIRVNEIQQQFPQYKKYFVQGEKQPEKVAPPLLQRPPI